MEISALALGYFAGIATGIGLVYLFALALRTRRQQLDQRMGDLNAQFSKLDSFVYQSDRERAQQYGALSETLRRLSDSTNRLQRTLANDRQRGAWGQEIAEGILEAAGFLRGTHYDSQQAIVDGNGPGIRPDYTFYLPNRLRIHMDVKFPYANYETYFTDSTVDETEREKVRARFIRDVKAQINETRKYIGLDTLDCALMFIPNEALFHFLSEDADIREYALKNKVIICSPLSLLVVLAMIRQASETFALEKSLGEIRVRLVRVTEDIEDYASAMGGLKETLNKLQDQITDLQGKRGDKLKRDAQKLHGLIDQRVAALESGTDGE